ncbi:response regulator [Flavivirga sp. 57AJ16]|uniref:response regulator n=1 Tax=Flavivirga sp. 57AJ16 TaxID=3025307 RepID=UPI002365F202|nr:response regulator [Flavivirga sp. 57AJ16]MDD7887716.1 response regulator [Flavivirga sp. 57AJ16]
MTTKLLNIILADDDADDRELFKEAIKESGLEANITMFENGSNLIKHLRKPGVLLPDILFLDLNMPCMSGVDCLNHLKKESELKDIAIVIYSTFSSDRDIETTFLAGASIYLNKPNNFQTLKNILKKVLQLDWQYQTSILNRNNFLFRL